MNALLLDERCSNNRQVQPIESITVDDKEGGIGDNFRSFLAIPRTFICWMRRLIENLPAHDRSSAVLRNAHANTAPQHPVSVMFALHDYVFHICTMSERIMVCRIRLIFPY